MKKLLIGTGIAIAGIGTIAFWQRDTIIRQAFAPTTQTTQEGTLPVALLKDSKPQEQEVIAENLNIPWELAFLPDGNMLVTERPGRLLKITDKKEVIPIEGVTHTGEGGLLGMALHPNFKSNNWIYLYLTTSKNGALTNQVERYTLSQNTLSDKTIILESIPGSRVHDGGRIAFGPDNLLYITTGDAGVEKNAQNTSSLAGKILRIHDDGRIPNDNPFSNAVYSYGHRNPQGIAWDAKGNLFATEHGRSGAASGFDEVNLITKGKNYGWPTIEGDETRDGMENPLAHSGSKETWAPSGATIMNNTLVFTGLRGQALYQADIQNGKIGTITRSHSNEFGRIRTVVYGPDNRLYILTNNTDGRGTPKPGDDKIIKL